MADKRPPPQAAELIQSSAGKAAEAPIMPPAITGRSLEGLGFDGDRMDGLMILKDELSLIITGAARSHYFDRLIGSGYTLQSQSKQILPEPMQAERKIIYDSPNQD
jgi:hypothetical protein